MSSSAGTSGPRYRARAHVAVRQLEPRPGERVGELSRIRHEAARNLFVNRVEPQGEVGGQHGGRDALGRIVGMRHRAGARAILRSPLIRSGRALRQFPFVAEQVFEEVVAPLRGRGGPGDFQAAGDRVSALAGAKAVLPAQALLVEAGRFRGRTHIGRGAGSVGLAEGVAAGDERHRLLVVHRHPREGLADIPRRGDRIGVAVRAFRVDVNQSHLHGSERVFEFPVAGIALVAQPGLLGAQ